MPPVPQAVEGDGEIDGGDENAGLAFTGRVLGAFVALVVLSAFVVAMIALAYYSKFELKTAPAGAARPAAGAGLNG